MNAVLRCLAAAASVAALAGCASTTAPAVLLTLPPAVAAVNAPAAPAGSAPLLLVRRVTIPEYLLARRVRYRADSSTLAEWPDTFWAERIETGVSRELVAALREQLPGWSVCEASCGDQPAALVVQVDLVPMDYLRSARSLQARARVVLGSAGAPTREPKVLERGYEVPAGADTAQAHARTVTELLRQVARDIAPLVRDATQR